MKLTAKKLKQFILEVINESRVDKKPTAFVNGYTQGSRDAERLAKKGEKQSTEGLQAYIQKATENHPNEKWRQGYAFAFKLMFSKQLSTPPTKGQLPFANAPSRPYNIKLRKEEMEDEKGGDFVFSVDPSEYINKDQDVQDMNQFISLILDSDGINYVTSKGRRGYYYEFGFADEDSYDPDPESYQAFLALSKALKKIGIPTLDDLFNSGQIGQGRTFMSIADYPDQVLSDGTPLPMGDIRITQNFTRPVDEQKLIEGEDDDVLQTILSLIDSGSVAQAFEFADDLDMEKELVQTMLKNIKTSAKGNTTLDVSDDAAVALVEYLKDRPEVDLKIKDWLSFGLPFKKPGPPPKKFPMVPNYDMYRGTAYFMLKNIMGEYESLKTLQESYDKNKSKIKYFSEEASGLVYIRPKSEGESEPIPSGFVRTSARLGQGPRNPKRYQMNQVEILISQPGFKAMEDVSISDPRGAEELQRQMDQVEKIYQDTLERLGPDQPDKNEDWNAWYTWTSQKLQSTERYNYSMGKLKNSRTVRLPYEYGEGPLSKINHSFNVDAKFISPGPEGEYVDIANFILKKRKITNQYGDLLDYNGKTIAPKRLQVAISNAPRSTRKKRKSRR